MNPWLLVPDGLIPTTRIIEPAIRESIAPDPLRIALPNTLAPADWLGHRIIFSRLCAPACAWVPGWLRKNGARYFYFIDDDFWSYRATDPVGNYYSRDDVMATLDAFILNAECVITTTEPLADALRRRFPRAYIALVASPFDFSVLPEISPQRPDGPLRVGFAGTERGSAFEPVVEAIRELNHSRPGAFEFEFIGHAPESLEEEANVVVFPPIAGYSDFLEFKAKRRWNVGLAPLSDTEFARSKTNNKFREYGALHIAGIYSDVTPYRESVTNGVDGLLVHNNRDAWRDALIWLAENRSECTGIGARASTTVWERHRLEAVIPSWQTALQHGPPASARHTRHAIAAGNMHSLATQWRQRLFVYRDIVRHAGYSGLFKHLWGRMTRGSLHT